MWTTKATTARVDPSERTFDERVCDVLVIGAGGAGMRAAIGAFDKGAKTLIVCKTLLGKAHTVMAEGGIAAALGDVDPEDSWEVHFSDTIVEGQHIGNWHMAEIFAKEAIDRVYELEQYGALFDRTKEGKISQRAFGAHTYRRLCHIGDRTGLELIRTLEDQVVKRGIPFMDEVAITGILKDGKGGRASAALGIDIKSGKLILFRFKAVILATGGFGRIYEVTSNSYESTGDGIALAYKAGAELADMEMIQFHPTGMIYPAGVRGLLVTEGVRGDGGILTNALGERFMSKYDAKRMELSARDVVARAIYSEITAGRGTKNGAVYLDISHKGADYIKQRLPSMYYQFLEFAGVDITKQKMEVAPTVHYQMGGVKVDPESCRTSVNGIYAAGEVASGLHGANRLGGNSLSDILVFGRRAGEAAAAEAAGVGLPEYGKRELDQEITRVLSPFAVKDGANPFHLKEEIAKNMWAHVGIVRNEKDLKAGLEELGRIREEASKVMAVGDRAYNQSWLDSLQVRDMILDCEVVIRSALERKESRGAHTRSDYPGKDDKGLVNIITVERGGKMEHEIVPVPKMPPNLQALIKEE
ncbi:MAG: FAD-binding protein [Nitrososphaerota archaeon]|jgi:succinate dehydrogenase / fumarate reductase flavoprotein subunit|nr:FAD-binding protein [Nitrososphaerota archaeon]MDG6955806.1 FAD-binding protein [Nitrososphaerota archaeon]MDG6959122.1 FAD-binding protein [Nitrososphaerota archaeon]MDG6968839.1 FAD-binding protein [Nitrososphaerota archaeon]MDG6976701.1 FAD-binding protein [Nitrososphaerota archaeon]